MYEKICLNNITKKTRVLQIYVRFETTNYILSFHENPTGSKVENVR